MSPSALPETTPVPSALKAAAVTGSEWDARVRRHLPVATSQILTFSSKEPLTLSKEPPERRGWVCWHDTGVQDAGRTRHAGYDKRV